MHYAHMVVIRHILASPFHPQTSGKLERCHTTLKREANQVPYEFPSQVEIVLADSASYYNFRCYHVTPGNVTPADVIRGRRKQILQGRKELQAQTQAQTRDHRKHYNLQLRILTRTC